MKGDFSRDTFDPLNHFSRVLVQQGRVLLDSDLNEQTAILLHYLRTLAADLIGPHGGPKRDCGFAILVPTGAEFVRVDDTRLAGDGDGGRAESLGRISKLNFLIGRGRYYVNGLLCENERLSAYARAGEAGLAQPDFSADELMEGREYLVYLRAWEQHVSSLADERIREVALGAHGPDTATRARVVWQVRTVEVSDPDFATLTCETIEGSELWGKLLEGWQPANRGMLRAKADEPDDTAASNPCITSPDARYRGAENQLYRVEIHRGTNQSGPATFKWSRENGSVLLPVRSVSGNTVTLEHMGRDARSGVQVGDWIEVVDDEYELGSETDALLQVTKVEPSDMTLTLSGTPATTRTDRNGRSTPRRNQLVRRWDHRAGDPRFGGLELSDGAAVIKERAAGNENWLALEDGVKIQFQPGGDYRPGDYWLIPARTETGDVEWPGPVGDPEARPPHGITDYHAPLARIEVAGNGDVTVTQDFRREFPPLAGCPAA